MHRTWSKSLNCRRAKRSMLWVMHDVYNLLLSVGKRSSISRLTESMARPKRPNGRWRWTTFPPVVGKRVVGRGRYWVDDQSRGNPKRCSSKMLVNDDHDSSWWGLMTHWWLITIMRGCQTVTWHLLVGVLLHQQLRQQLVLRGKAQQSSLIFEAQFSNTQISLKIEHAHTEKLGVRTSQRATSSQHLCF